MAKTKGFLAILRSEIRDRHRWKRSNLRRYLQEELDLTLRYHGGSSDILVDEHGNEYDLSFKNIDKTIRKLGLKSVDLAVRHRILTSSADDSIFPPLWADQ